MTGDGNKNAVGLPAANPATPAAAPSSSGVRSVAVIDIGSSAIRMEIATVAPSGAIEVIETLRRSVTLGLDSFSQGRIQTRSINLAIDVLRGYQEIVKSYGVQVVRAVATSAVREAGNRELFVDRIYMATGITVEVISGAEESHLLYRAVRDAFRACKLDAYLDALIVEQGSGHSDLTMLENGEVVTTISVAMGTLRLANEVAAEQQPIDRAEARRMRLELWWQLRRLMKVGLVFRYSRGSVSVYNLPRQYVNRRRRSRAGSTLSSRFASKAHQRDIPVSKSRHTKMLPECGAASSPQPSVAKSESAQAALSSPALPISIPVKPDAGPTLTRTKEQEERICVAARGLARLPRKAKRRWSGYANGVRVWHNRKIILPWGKIAYCYGCLRGKLNWTSCPTSKDPAATQEMEWDVIDAHRVRMAKDENAVLLGRAKLGVRERKSGPKALAARRNGVKPCRPGRRRGRPARMALGALDGLCGTAPGRPSNGGGE